MPVITFCRNFRFQNLIQALAGSLEKNRTAATRNNFGIQYMERLGAPKRRSDSDVITTETVIFSETAIETQEKDIPLVFL
jgi:hypothetical protein